MTKSLKVSVLLALGLLVASAHVIRAQDTLPKASEILAKSADAMGGAQAFKAVKSMRSRGTFEMPAQNLTGTVEIIQARPAQVRLTVTIQGMGVSESGCDGKIAWSMDPMSGPSLMETTSAYDAPLDRKRRSWAIRFLIRVARFWLSARVCSSAVRASRNSSSAMDPIRKCG